MNDDEIMNMLSGADKVKTFADSLVGRSPNTYGEDMAILDKEVVDSHYIRSRDDYGTTDSARGVDRDNKMPSGSIAKIASKMNNLSEEAYRIMLREAEARDMSILNVILEKARDRVIQPDVLDELEQKAVEDKFSKIPDLVMEKKYTTKDGITYKDWNSRADTGWK